MFVLSTTVGPFFVKYVYSRCTLQGRLQTLRLQTNKALGIAVLHGPLALRVSSAAAQHELVYVSSGQPAVPVSRHLHHLSPRLVDYSACLHNHASCTWSLFWYSQTLLEDPSQDL